MKIDNLNYEITKISVILSADITYSKEQPFNLYFKVSSKYSDLIVNDYAPFYAAMLMPSMVLNEDLTIAGSIPKALLSRSYDNQIILNKWDRKFQKIKIKTSTSQDTFIGNHIACFFSGGVDSFSTLINNLKTNKNKIGYLLLVHGFDINLKNKKLFDATYQNILSYANKTGLEVISIETNIRDITDSIVSWNFAHGGALASTALLLRKGFKTIYIPSSYQTKQLFPWGSHPDLDKNWSTESLRVRHDGSNFTRLEKILSLSDSPLVLKHLRVCWKNREGKYNCGKCNKCIRTMIELHIAGLLSESETFPQKLDLKQVENLYSPDHSSRTFIDEIIIFLKNKGGDETDLANALRKSLRRRFFLDVKRKLATHIGNLDKKYNKRKLYFFLSRKGINF